jgi:outer membrane protein insertion porin family
LNVVDYSTDDKGARVSYGFPMTEYNTARLGFELKNTELKTTTGSDVLVFKDWVCDFFDEPAQCDKTSANFTTLSVDTSYSHDTRNRTFFASEGTQHQVSAEAALPGLDLQYYKLRYNYEANWPVVGGTILQARASLGYGNGYGATEDLPFFENFYAGGVTSVRGFKGNSLGTDATKEDEYRADGTLKKANSVSVGGALRTVANLELIFPLPFAENSKSFRVSTFVDVGNVFAGAGDFDVDELRSSYGFQALWVTPVGVLTFSWGWPLNAKAGDEREIFQFFIGAPF